MSQKSDILAHLKAGHTLTALQGLVKFGSLQFGARIFELKRDGNDIRSEGVMTPDGKRIVRYSLAPEARA